ncbi:MAG: hypothetical protein KAT91_02520 [Candidatus Aenigmarchaeota archaeon]|nr:hypothetical protein [Candidatus Aenigmarchaeota archaeon]
MARGDFNAVYISEEDARNNGERPFQQTVSMINLSAGTAFYAGEDLADIHTRAYNELTSTAQAKIQQLNDNAADAFTGTDFEPQFFGVLVEEDYSYGLRGLAGEKIATAVYDGLGRIANKIGRTPPTQKAEIEGTVMIYGRYGWPETS